MDKVSFFLSDGLRDCDIDFDLALAGHSHLGEIRIPYLLNLANKDYASKYINPYYEINNTAGSLVGGYYENESWHWVTGEEFVVNRDHFYYPSAIDPSEGDVLATWFESAKNMGGIS